MQANGLAATLVHFVGQAGLPWESYSMSTYADCPNSKVRATLNIRNRLKLRNVGIYQMPMLYLGTVPIKSSPSHRKAWNVGINIIAHFVSAGRA